jgi:hypothetical protein
MKLKPGALIVFTVAFIVYFAVATRFTFHPRWSLDYFNPIAHSLLAGRLDIPTPQGTYDLVTFGGKWYTVWGVLPSLFLIPAQILKGRYVPPIYLSVLFGSLNVAIFYLLLKRVKKEFIPQLKKIDIVVLLIFFAFGTTQFYVTTLGSVWHVSQMVSTFFGNAGIYMIFRKRRALKDYFLSSLLISISFLGRVTTVFLILLPIMLNSKKNCKNFAAIALPFIFFLCLFLGYNTVRFGNPFEYGYSYITEAPSLAAVRIANGVSSIRNIPNNFWHMALEIPKITLLPRPELHPNLLGNSIFFLSPPLLYIFWASPLNPFVAGIWSTVLFSLIPVLMHYSTGWMQFGYRYTLDVTMLLVLLTVFALKGKLAPLYYGGVLFSVIMYSWGILLMQ